MLETNVLLDALKIVVTSAIFFVWFIRYDNIKKEFKEYNLPTWFRDIVGILKISFSLMIHSSNKDIVFIGSLGILVLMFGAVTTHIRMKNNFRKYIASVAMLTITSFILLFTI
ncbi:MAG: hypothetical protein CMG49_03070 [Candidatus Marinimicrobia bacterium]|nr:hypothetical protein [Candidatus Neomarinimicrobiota bacterium]|tara:strand:+ start:434 stop:772 length:339 start_codon:yes stop_codon:yes gene_type:complete